MSARALRRAVLTAAALGVAGLLAACSSAGRPAPSPTSSSSAGGGAALSGTLTVFAAASLKAAFTELAERFMAAHPGVSVQTSFAGSSDLVTQITEGAPADVFASADTRNMDKLVGAGLVAGEPIPFATNVLEIAVPPGNPAGIGSFADLAKPGVKLVVCAPQVPCGSATVSVEQSSGVTLAPVSEESSVADVLAKVESGEADAGLVYVTDVAGAGPAVQGVPFPESSAAVNTYPIAVIAGASDPVAAEAFVELVAGEQGQEVLSAAGFGRP